PGTSQPRGDAPLAQFPLRAAIRTVRGPARRHKTGKTGGFDHPAPTLRSTPRARRAVPASPTVSARHGWRDALGLFSIMAPVPPANKSRRSARRDVGRLIARLLCFLFAFVGLIPVAGGFLLGSAPVHRWAARETARLLQEHL